MQIVEYKVDRYQTPLTHEFPYIHIEYILQHIAIYKQKRYECSSPISRLPSGFRILY